MHSTTYNATKYTTQHTTCTYSPRPRPCPTPPKRKHTTTQTTALIIAGLVKTVPEYRKLYACTTKEKSLADSGVCWKNFWNSNSVMFILTCVGVGCLLVSLLTCCCCCCASGPKKAKDQFIAGSSGGGHGQYDAAGAADQYGGYGAQPGAKGAPHV
jgi:hypothetical protein